MSLISLTTEQEQVPLRNEPSVYNGIWGEKLWCFSITIFLKQVGCVLSLSRKEILSSIINVLVESDVEDGIAVLKHLIFLRGL